MGIEPLLQSSVSVFSTPRRPTSLSPIGRATAALSARTGSTGKPATCGSGRQTKSGEGTCGGHGGKTGEFSDLEFSKTETTTGQAFRSEHAIDA